MLAQQLMLLYDGAIVAAQMDGNAAAQAARATAGSLIDAALGRRRASSSSPCAMRTQILWFLPTVERFFLLRQQLPNE